MKSKIRPTQLAKTPQIRVSPKKLRDLRSNLKAATPGPKSQKRDNIFSKSRGIREDRGRHPLKTTHDSQVLFRICGHASP
jgi:hypothetical protein